MSDCWKAYDCLENEGYIHGTVNHSIEFINSETGNHTQSIESTWRAVKKLLPRSGSIKGMHDSYFAEFIFRQRYLADVEDKFLTFLQYIHKVYNPMETDGD